VLFVFRTRGGLEHYAETDRLLRESFGLESVRHDGDSLAALEPALKPGHRVLAQDFHWQVVSLGCRA
jgi:D-amino-acid dehydrogenase